MLRKDVALYDQSFNKAIITCLINELFSKRIWKCCAELKHIWKTKAIGQASQEGEENIFSKNLYMLGTKKIGG